MTRFAFALPLTAALSLLTIAAHADNFTYYPPGELLTDTGEGRKDDRQIYFPGMAFPLKTGTVNNAHAYAGSQIYNVRGGGANAAENYVYPWRDNYCEKRSWSMPLCPSGTGHQGVDIRPSLNQKDVWEAVAMDDGTVTSATDYTTVTIRSDNGYYCRYMHMSQNSIRDSGTKALPRVKRGITVIGRASNIMGGIPNTSLHLHFDCYKRVSNQIVRFPVYTSLVSAYRANWGLPSVDVEGKLGEDGHGEVSSEHGGEITQCPPFGASIGTETRFNFTSLWAHNCSLMGLVADGDKRQLIYYKPAQAVRVLVKDDPVLFSGAFADGRYAGEAKVYNSICGALSFPVEGPVAGDFRSVSMSGQRPVRDGACALTGTRLTELPFTYVGKFPPDEVPVVNAAPEVPVVTVGAEPKKGINLGELLFQNVLDRAYPNMAAVWPNRNIPVCWENPTPASADDRALIQAAAEQSWEKHSALDFTGWQPCVANNQGIRILIEDSGAHMKGLGILGNGVRNGMVLNTTFRNWNQSCANSEERRRSCIYSITVHEFGHAIGFAHEHNRPDTPGECTKAPQGSSGDTLLTPYDPRSTMNYCNLVYNNDGRLSDWDIAAVQYIYGEK